MKAEARKEARELRKKGKSLDDINDNVEASRSRIYEWIRDIEVTKEMEDRFSENRRKSALELNSNGLDDETKQKISEKMKQNYVEGKIDPPHGNLTMRESERKTKNGVEEYLETENLTPQKIDGRFIDLVNNEYAVEVTFDNTKGISDAIERLNDIETSKKKIIVCPSEWFGEKRKNRIKDAEHIPIENISITEGVN